MTNKIIKKTRKKNTNIYMIEEKKTGFYFRKLYTSRKIFRGFEASSGIRGEKSMTSEAISGEVDPPIKILN